MLRIVSRRLGQRLLVGGRDERGAELGGERRASRGCARCTSACLVSAQKPGPPSFSWCQKTGASRRRRSNWSWGTPRPHVLASRSMSSRRSSVTVTGGSPWCVAVTTPRRAATARSSVTASGSTRRIISRPSSRPMTAGPGARVRRPRRRPTPRIRCRPRPPRYRADRWARACVVAGGVGPQLVLEGDPAAVARHRVGDVAPEGGQLLVERGRGGELGADHRGDVVDPALEQREEQALLAAEVVVDRAGGAVGGLGDGVDRRAVDAPLGEQLGGGVEQRAAGLRPPFPLGGHPERLAALSI